VLLQNTINLTQKTVNNFYDLQVQNRYLRWLITANEAGGYFVMGQPLLHYRTGDSSP
jgi:hypothetical protein